MIGGPRRLRKIPASGAARGAAGFVTVITAPGGGIDHIAVLQREHPTHDDDDHRRQRHDPFLRRLSRQAHAQRQRDHRQIVKEDQQ